MRNEQVFSDVPTSHRYSKYIWAMNKLGIMNGVGGGKFNPDSELSMQEFAVMATNIIQWEKAKAVEIAATWKDTNSLIDEYKPEEIAQIDADYRKRAEEGYTLPADGRYTSKVFADDDQIATWAKAAVDELSAWGILQGDSSGSNSRLNPTEALSKTRFLVFLYKFDQKFSLSAEIVF
jgi:hypothetical protein